MISSMILICFLEFEFLSQREDFAWAIAFACMMADFQNALISRIFSIFLTFFCTKQLQMICRMAFDMFLEFVFFSQSEDFTGAIAFAFRMPDF